MDHFGLILKDLGPGLWAVSLDLINAYLHILLDQHTGSSCAWRRGIIISSSLACVLVYPVAPCMFNKVMVEIVGLHEEKGAQMFQYLDN